MPTPRKRAKLSEVQKDATQFKDMRLEVDNEEGALIVVSDLNVAAYLKIVGYQLFEARNSENAKVFEFVFKVLDPKNPQEAAQTILDFYNNKGIAGRYLDYTNAWKDLRTLMPHLR